MKNWEKVTKKNKQTAENYSEIFIVRNNLTGEEESNNIKPKGGDYLVLWSSAKPAWCTLQCTPP